MLIELKRKKNTIKEMLINLRISYIQIQTVVCEQIIAECVYNLVNIYGGRVGKHN